MTSIAVLAIIRRQDAINDAAWRAVKANYIATRRKAQETTRKEETMPTLLGDLDNLRDKALHGFAEFMVAPPYKRLRAFIEANTPWLPPQQEGFGPWIEWKPGDPGPRVMDEVSLLLWRERENRLYKEGCVYIGHEVHWSRDSDDDTRIVAYCVKLEPTNE